jgi:hypothetical protein
MSVRADNFTIAFPNPRPSSPPHRGSAANVFHQQPRQNKNGKGNIVSIQNTKLTIIHDGRFAVFLSEQVDLKPRWITLISLPWKPKPIYILMILLYMFLLSELTQHFKHYTFIYIPQNVSAIITQNHSNLNGNSAEMNGLNLSVKLRTLAICPVKE